MRALSVERARLAPKNGRLTAKKQPDLFTYSKITGEFCSSLTRARAGRKTKSGYRTIKIDGDYYYEHLRGQYD